jgi:predicted porin
MPIQRKVMLLGGAVSAAFFLGGPAAAQTVATVTCTSEPGQRLECPADTSGGVALERQTGTAECLLGVNWGYDTTSVWVSDGCGGAFTLGRAVRPDEENEAGFVGRYEVYGRFLAHGAAFDDEMEMQNSASWIGFDYSTGDEVKFFARWEWGVNFIRGGTQLNPGATTSSGFLTLDTVETPLLGNRLGYVGVDFGPAGRLTVGKQKSVHYDIANYTTDRPNVFSGEGSLAYPAGTDGGPSGTGRADQALTYRLTALEILDLGGQVQLLTANNDEFLDGWGLSAQVTVLPGLKVGGAWTERYYSQEFKDNVVNLQGSANYGILGANYSSDLFDLAGVWATQRNGDGRVVDLPGLEEDGRVPVVFDGDGVELYGTVNLGRFTVLGGFVDYRPDDVDGVLIHPDTRIRYVFLGAEWNIKQNGFAYTEWRIDDSVDASGTEGFSVFTLGLRYGFSMKGSHGIY